MRFILFGRSKDDNNDKRAESLTNALLDSSDPMMIINKMASIIPSDLKDRLVEVLINGKNSSKEEKREDIEDRIRLFVENKRGDMDVLHTIDQVVGGRGTEFGDQEGIYGNSRVNRHIGTLWGGDGGRVGILDNAVKGVRGDAMMKVELKAV